MTDLTLADVRGPARHTERGGRGARPVPGAAPPRPLEHSALRWVGPAEIDDLDWLDADRAVLAELGTLLVRDGEPRGTAAGAGPSKGA